MISLFVPDLRPYTHSLSLQIVRFIFFLPFFFSRIHRNGSILDHRLDASSRRQGFMNTSRCDRTTFD